MRYRTAKVKNGDMLVDFVIYKCCICGCDIPECDPHHINTSNIYCWECAFKSGFITSEEYVKHCGICLSGVKAAISPLTGEIEVTTDKYFSWQKSDKQQRNTNEYAEWRKSVFERDNYTCQICGQSGGILNAHHIEPFAKYKKLRLKLSNGITLCEACHKKVHKGVVKIE